MLTFLQALQASASAFLFSFAVIPAPDRDIRTIMVLAVAAINLLLLLWKHPRAQQMENFSHSMGPTETISHLSATMRLVSARVSHHYPTLSTLHTIYGPNKSYEFLTRDHPENPFETLFVKTIGWPDPTNLKDTL